MLYIVVFAIFGLLLYLASLKLNPWVKCSKCKNQPRRKGGWLTTHTTPAPVARARGKNFGWAGGSSSESRCPHTNADAGGSATSLVPALVRQFNDGPLDVHLVGGLRYVNTQSHPYLSGFAGTASGHGADTLRGAHSSGFSRSFQSCIRRQFPD